MNDGWRRGSWYHGGFRSGRGWGGFGSAGLYAYAPYGRPPNASDDYRPGGCDPNDPFAFANTECNGEAYGW